MTSKVTLIEGGKKDVKMCPYCGMVPESEHPDYTCPRILAVSEDGFQYIDIHQWERFLEGHGLHVPGFPDEKTD